MFHRARQTTGVEKDRMTRYSHPPLCSRNGGDIDESIQDESMALWRAQDPSYSPAVVELPLLRTASRLFLLFLLFNLGRLRLDLAGARKRPVNWAKRAMS